MVSFYLSFKSRLIEEIVEDEGAIWTDERISWISINRGYYHYNKVQVVDGALCSCVGVLLGAVYCRAGSRSVLSAWLPFCVFL